MTRIILPCASHGVSPTTITRFVGGFFSNFNAAKNISNTKQNASRKKNVFYSYRDRVLIV